MKRCRHSCEVLGRRGFTLVELIVVVAIILVLIGIITPMVGSMRKQARVAFVTNQLMSLSKALESYFQDHNMYPPSRVDNTASPPAYGGKIPDHRGSCALAQGLVGYLRHNGTLTGPPYGFRLIRDGSGNAKGRVYGPYINPTIPVVPTGENEAKSKDYHVKISGGTEEHAFVDYFSNEIRNEILYYRAERVADPNKVFGNDAHSYFIFDDNKDAGGNAGTLSDLTNVNRARAFFDKLGMTENTLSATNSSAMLLGRDSYILISAGYDGEYFSKDDIVMSKP